MLRYHTKCTKKLCKMSKWLRQTSEYLMGDVPKERVNIGDKPFFNTSIDSLILLLMLKWTKKQGQTLVPQRDKEYCSRAWRRGLSILNQSKFINWYIYIDSSPIHIKMWKCTSNTIRQRYQFCRWVVLYVRSSRQYFYFYKTYFKPKIHKTITSN